MADHTNKHVILECDNYELTSLTSSWPIPLLTSSMIWYIFLHQQTCLYATFMLLDQCKNEKKKMLKQLPVERSLMIISEGANTSYHIIKWNYVFSVVSALALACTVQPYIMFPSSHGLSSQCLQGIFILLSVSLGFHIGFRLVLLAAHLNDHFV